MSHLKSALKSLSRGHERSVEVKNVDKKSKKKSNFCHCWKLINYTYKKALVSFWNHQLKGQSRSFKVKKCFHQFCPLFWPSNITRFKNPGKRFARMSGERFGKNGRSRRRTFLGLVLTRIYSQGLNSSILIFKLYSKFDNFNPF